VLIKPGMVVPGNTHFDTTKAHIEFQNGKAIDCSVDAIRDIHSEEPFKGNIDSAKLTQALEKFGMDNVAYVLITVTCNSGGGQPVSMQNIKEVSKITKGYGVPLLFDAARYAENAYFIKTRESGYEDTSIPEIVREMMSYADGCLMSSKKDAIVPIGGFIALRDKDLYDKLVPYNVLFEGFVTYGGMAGHDMEALAVGLREGIDEAYLAHRIGQITAFGKKLVAAGIPTLTPFGGHAVYLDAASFFPHIPRDQFPGHALACALYLAGGVRSVEVGTLMNGRNQETGENLRSNMELTRLAVPRRVYTAEHLEFVAETIKAVWEKRESLTGFIFVNESPILRHFQSTFLPSGEFPV